MYCRQCGARLRDGAKFCTLCGAQTEADSFETIGSSTEPVATKRQSLASFLTSTRQVGSFAAPTFALIIAAIIAFAGAAYAAVMVYKNVIEPAITQRQVPEEQRQTETEIETEVEPEQEPDPTAELNERAHDSYREIVAQYRQALASGYDAETTPYAEPISLWQTKPANMSYAYLDTNADGVDELVITSDEEAGLVSALYKFDDTASKSDRLTTSGTAREWTHLCEGNVLKHYGAGGAAIGSVEYTAADGTELESLSWDRLVTDGVVTVTHSTNGTADDTFTIPYTSDWQTNERYASYQDALAEKYPIRTGIDWIDIL